MTEQAAEVYEMFLAVGPLGQGDGGPLLHKLGGSHLAGMVLRWHSVHCYVSPAGCQGFCACTTTARLGGARPSEMSKGNLKPL